MNLAGSYLSAGHNMWCSMVYLKIWHMNDNSSRDWQIAYLLTKVGFGVYKK